MTERKKITKRLVNRPFLGDNKHELFMHGRVYDGPMHQPAVLWKSEENPRDDHESQTWLTASEFQDHPDALGHKCRQLAQMLRLSKNTVVYTGAGISASVIGQAARSGTNQVGWKGDTRTCKPTLTHRILSHLIRQGLVQSWQQQNHDGLPQKAGCPQDKINEIHGSWYNPHNPVVKYSGTLHELCYPWMRNDALTADLVLVLGTSLGGLNADQVVTKTARRSLLEPCSSISVGAQVVANGKRAKVVSVDKTSGVVVVAYPEGSESDSDSEAPQTLQLDAVRLVKAGPQASLGSVCINLQQTPQDGKMSLRLFGKSDDVLCVLLRELGMDTTDLPVEPAWPKSSRVQVPYDADGVLVTNTRKMWLDLCKGKKIKITPGHNIQGARQPAYLHIGADKDYTRKVKGKVKVTKAAPGYGTVVRRDEPSSSFVLNIEGATMRLGLWWLEAAVRGTVPTIPIVNQNPDFV